ncbi:hypothetical protein JZ751_006342 [Albula glossodonta]|uniref:Rab-GAP TBC domain-containing protein n=1 Tax=Albula glossodonta TaxID=121402 RepID=A0A8T2N341_9TELE|nr:hypothetical protein JZ751_006342 [Albula glossodonta]
MLCQPPGCLTFHQASGEIRGSPHQPLFQIDVPNTFSSHLFRESGGSQVTSQPQRTWKRSFEIRPVSQAPELLSSNKTFHRGVSPAERGQVWRFLFGMYPCSSTALERPLLEEQLAVRYQVMKRKWQQLLPECVRLRLNGTDGMHQDGDGSEMEFAELVLFERFTFDLEELQEAIRIIDKDVPRTDRDVPYYLRFLEVLDSEVDTWLLLGFQREFEHSEALRLFEILSCDHLELISQQVDRAHYRERLARKHSLEENPTTEPQAINTEFTFELFICAAILLEHRDTLLNLQGTLDLNSILKKAEGHFYNYCKRSAWDHLNGRCRNRKSKEDQFIHQLRNLFS